jgi:hypothetical protein
VKELAVEFKSLEKGGIARIAEQHPVQEAQAELLALVEGLQLRVKGFRQLTRQCNVGLVVALAWSLLGFGLWYLRLQEPLDLRLKLETDVAMAELQLKKAQLQASARESVTTPPSSK